MKQIRVGLRGLTRETLDKLQEKYPNEKSLADIVIKLIMKEVSERDETTETRSV